MMTGAPTSPMETRGRSVLAKPFPRICNSPPAIAAGGVTCEIWGLESEDFRRGIGDIKIVAPSGKGADAKREAEAPGGHTHSCASAPYTVHCSMRESAFRSFSETGPGHLLSHASRRRTGSGVVEGSDQRGPQAHRRRC